MASITDDSGFNQGYQCTLAQNVRMRRRCDAMRGEMCTRFPRVVLEAGCGTGELSHLLAENSPETRVVGIDKCLAFIESAKASYQRSNLEFHHLDLQSTMLSRHFGHQFDYIVGNGLLHHLYYRLDEVLSMFRESIDAGGKLIFWEPNLWNPYIFAIFKLPVFRLWAKLAPDEMAFTKTFISTALVRCGFENLAVECRDFLLPNTPAALIGPVSRVGALLEKLPVMSNCAQSLFLSAQVPQCRSTTG